MKLQYMVNKKKVRRGKTLEFREIVIKRCQHKKKFAHKCHSILPEELLTLIWEYIDDAKTLMAFAKAFSFELCQHSFCYQLAMQRWLEEDMEDVITLETKNIAETEYTKINNDHQNIALFYPTVYKISKQPDGFAITSFKRHFLPQYYEHFFSRNPHLYPPETEVEPEINDGRRLIYTPYRLIHVYSPSFHHYYLNVHEPTPSDLKHQYKKIEAYFNDNKSGVLWIYPWTSFRYQINDEWKPCQEWVDTLMLIYDFQQKHSSLLNKRRNKVS